MRTLQSRSFFYLWSVSSFLKSFSYFVGSTLILFAHKVQAILVLTCCIYNSFDDQTAIGDILRYRWGDVGKLLICTAYVAFCCLESRVNIWAPGVVLPAKREHNSSGNKFFYCFYIWLHDNYLTQKILQKTPSPGLNQLHALSAKEIFQRQPVYWQTKL